MKNSAVVDKLMNSPRVRSLGLKREIILDILKTYSDISLEYLLENGSIELGNGMIIEVVQLLDRVHVLRGTTYRSNRKYKLKLTMEDTIYKKIENYYDKLQEEIG